jgi:hypothetical protein
MVDCGGSRTFLITPSNCYRIESLFVDGVSVGAVSSYTFNDVQQDHTLEGSFVTTDYTIVATAGPGGSIQPQGSATVSCFSSKSYTITPSACRAIQDVTVDGISVGAVSATRSPTSWRTTRLRPRSRPSAIRSRPRRASGGTISPAGTVLRDVRQLERFHIVPADCNTS